MRFGQRMSISLILMFCEGKEMNRFMSQDTSRLHDTDGVKLWLWFVMLVLVLLGGGIGTVPSAATQDSLDEFTMQLDTRLPQLMRDYAIPGMSIALIQDGEVVWKGAYGYADRAMNRHMTVDTFYRVQSISKSVTSWGVMRLVEQGMVDLDKPVSTYLNGWELPASDYTEEAVTIRRLLSHSAGMPLGDISAQYSPRDDVPALHDTVLAEAHLIYEPGTRFEYSNTGFNLLELVIEEVTGRDFAEYMASEVLLPLGMSDASFNWTEALDARMATGYDLNGEPVDRYVYPEKASGGLLASVEAVAQFVRAGINNADQAILEPPQVQRLYKPVINVTGIFGMVSDSYGFGHFLETLPNGQQAAWHGGQGNGWMSHFHSVPELGVGIVILTNSQRSWPAISAILTDWASWNDLESVKMGRIAEGMIVIRLLIILLWLASLFLLYRLIRGFIKRRWRGLSSGFHLWCLLQAGLGLGLIALAIWVDSMLSLMLAAVFPDMMRSLSISLAIFAGLILFGALLNPRT